jgi:energy-coupling factor transport system permease protein
MVTVAPVADPTAPLARRNPVAKLVASFAASAPLFATLDPLAPAVALLVELAVVPAFGLRWRDLARRTWPVLPGVVGVALVQLVFTGAHPGAVVFHSGPILVTTGALMNAAGLSLRLVAVAVPAALVFASTDPTDLADALIQNARAPARFAIGALAAFRLLPLLSDEWRMLTLARRARGIDAGANPVRHLRLFAGTTFALLVGAIRRGTRLATAMDARGFDSRTPRTVARPQRFTAADAALAVSGFAVGAIALGASILTGLFRPLL